MAVMVTGHGAGSARAWPTPVDDAAPNSLSAAARVRMRPRGGGDQLIRLEHCRACGRGRASPLPIGAEIRRTVYP
jgi:hypothetical protein